MQTTSNILLIRPVCFGFNDETAESNAFQVKVKETAQSIREIVSLEFDRVAEELRSAGVNLFVFDDTPFPAKPDAIFPNNWVSFHADGTVILYPMFAENRRHERREYIIDALAKQFRVKNIVDFSGYEKQNKFLEGTGSIVFDHVNRIAYASLSARTHRDVLVAVCEHLRYKPVSFHSHDSDGKVIYHTNVMMCVGNDFAVICLESISDQLERERVSHSLRESGHQLVDITFEQVSNFAGNALSVTATGGRKILLLSQRAFDSLTPDQIQSIEMHVAIIPLAIETIETVGGGSVRCMMAEIFLDPIN
ncbi:MAG: citrulline utilization hydrolase CtlX [Pyrinomonadaceae bacterium]